MPEYKIEDNACITCGRVIPEGRQICLRCGSYDRQQTFRTKVITNADKIRNMTDEELIPVVMDYVCKIREKYCPTNGCGDCVRHWLESKVDGGDKNER